MKKKIVEQENSLAVLLPTEVVDELKLEAGMAVDVSVHPRTGAVILRPDV